MWVAEKEARSCNLCAVGGLRFNCTDLASCASHRVTNVCLTRYHTEDILPAFASCLEILPNLHTLQIVHAHSQMATALKNAFQRRSYPQIRKVVMPSVAHHILKCCPEVREVVCTQEDGRKLITALKAGHCSKVEVLEGFIPDDPMMKRK